MNNEEVNKIIANYMDRDMRDFRNGDCRDWRTYTLSLDALIPVWEKMGSGFGLDAYIQDNKKWCLNLDGSDLMFTRNTIQESAAHATAKAIMGKIK